LLAGYLQPIKLVGAGAPVVDRARTALRQLRTLSRLDFKRRGVLLERRGIIEGEPPVKLLPRVVRKIQAKLQRLGYYDGRRDGYYGPDVEAGLYAFQQVAGLEADGIWGRATRAAMRDTLIALNEPAEPEPELESEAPPA